MYGVQCLTILGDNSGASGNTVGQEPQRCGDRWFNRDVPVLAVLLDALKQGPGEWNFKQSPDRNPSSRKSIKTPHPHFFLRLLGRNPHLPSLDPNAARRIATRRK